MQIIIDTREKRPYGFGGKVASEVRKLQTGDYSIAGLENEVAIERKSLDDFIGSLVNSNRETFQRELDRLVHMPTKAIVVEGSWECIKMGQYRSRMNPAAAYGSAMGIIAQGIPIVMAGTRKEAERACYALLRIAYNRYQYRLRDLAKGKIIRAAQAS